MPCLDTIQTINKTDCIGNSRETINNNFQSVKNFVCNLQIEQEITEAKTVHDVPIYGIIMYYGDITSPGADFNANGRGKTTKNLQSYVLCDGRNGTPDMRDRFVVGAGMNYGHKTYGPGTITNDNSSLSLAFSSVRLTIAEMPQHNHEGMALDKWTGGSSAHKHRINTDDLLQRAGPDDENDAGNTGFENFQPDSVLETKIDGIHEHKLKIENTGGSLKHENRPPYIALGYIMRSPTDL
jgi:microcystin-dependent protein